MGALGRVRGGGDGVGRLTLLRVNHQIAVPRIAIVIKSDKITTGVLFFCTLLSNFGFYTNTYIKHFFVRFPTSLRNWASENIGNNSLGVSRFCIGFRMTADNLLAIARDLQPSCESP